MTSQSGHAVGAVDFVSARVCSVGFTVSFCSSSGLYYSQLSVLGLSGRITALLISVSPYDGGTSSVGTTVIRLLPYSRGPRSSYESSPVSIVDGHKLAILNVRPF